MTFGEKLQEIRRNNNISQEKLAEMLNVSRQSVSKWERDHGYPEIDKLIYMCDIFNVSLDELLRGKQTQTYADPCIQEAEMSDRRPISLVKEPEVQEIYPGENKQPSFQSQDPAGVAQYYNYNACSSSPGYFAGSAPARNKRRLSLKNIICIAAGVLIVGTALCGVAFVSSRSSHSNVYYDTSDNTYDDTDFTYSVSCYTDSDGMYYIVDGDYGIADQIYNNEFKDYIKVSNIESGEEKYLYGNYANDREGYSTVYTTEDGSQSVAIPSYIPESTISAQNINDYTILYNTADDNLPYFVPDYILPEVLRDSHQSNELPDVDGIKNEQVDAENVENAENLQADE